MRVYDLITKKKRGMELNKAEIEFLVNGYVKDEIPDYQMSAFLMAVWHKGMSEEETSHFTLAMANSGDTMDLSGVEGMTADKHSTGGVGDKTTLIVCPIVASCGGKVAKMSGRGLGHTGGTIDKLEAIPNFKTSVSKDEFIHIVNTVGVSVIGQSENLVPADKKIYALRDVTATVDSIPLIASSVMSKKIASGADAIVLDVKFGSGAFMKTHSDAARLARYAVGIGQSLGKKIIAVGSNMDVPLGEAIGTSLEVMESMEVLKGRGPSDVKEVSLYLATKMLFLLGKGEEAKCRKMAEEAIESGRAFDVFCRMVEMQGGDSSYIKDDYKFKRAEFSLDIISGEEGYVESMNTEIIGETASVLGAGRDRKDDIIDYTAGIMIYKKSGDYVKKGEKIATLYTSDDEKLPLSRERFMQGIKIGKDKPKSMKLIYPLAE